MTAVRKGHNVVRPLSLPVGPGEAELRGQDLRVAGGLVCLGWPGQPSSALHHLVSWLESCASLTRLCTSMSVPVPRA